MSEEVPETPGVVKKLYVIYLTQVLKKGATSKKERKLLFEFASFVDNVVEGKNEQKES